VSFILSIDQGTTGTRAVVTAPDGQTLGVGYARLDATFPQPGWVEQDPEAIWQSVIGPTQTALERARVKPSDLAAIGITNQRETIIIWERATGQALLPAIV